MDTLSSLMIDRKGNAMHIRQKAFQDEEDYERLRQLLFATGAITDPPINCSVGDLDWWRFGHGSLMRETCVWESLQEEFVGAAWLEDGEINQFIHPNYREVESLMYDWAEQRQHQISHNNAGPNSLIAWTYRGDLTRESLLNASGYVKDGSFLLHRQLSLTGLLPAPILPAGYVIRQIDGMHEVDQRAAVYCRAFHPSMYSAERHRSIITSPTYRHDLDLVVVAPDGLFVACILLWYDAVNQHGVIEPMGTDPAYRRLGFGKALLAEGTRRLQSVGATQAMVCTHCKNTSANQLYDSSGFRVFAVQDRWMKTL